jgi:hypothetical protein
LNDPIHAPESGADCGNPLSCWIVVTQVKSDRVVYFTDDPGYQPPMEGDWYYCSPF